MRRIVDDIDKRLSDAIAELGAVADALTSEDAPASLDKDTLQVFWRDWPNISSWAGSLWRRINDEVGHAAKPPDPELEDVGGEGGA